MLNSACLYTCSRLFPEPGVELHEHDGGAVPADVRRDGGAHQRRLLRQRVSGCRRAILRAAGTSSQRNEHIPSHYTNRASAVSFFHLFSTKKKITFV